MGRDVDMATMRLVLIAVAFGLAISVAIEFVSRIEVRALYAALYRSSRTKPPVRYDRHESIMRSASLARCAALAVVLSALTYGSMVRSALSVVAMIIVTMSYLTYVSWVEIRRLRRTPAD
jgi:hypothetical protein